MFEGFLLSGVDPLVSNTRPSRRRTAWTFRLDRLEDRLALSGLAEYGGSSGLGDQPPPSVADVAPPRAGGRPLGGRRRQPRPRRGRHGVSLRRFARLQPRDEPRHGRHGRGPDSVRRRRRHHLVDGPGRRPARRFGDEARRPPRPTPRARDLSDRGFRRHRARLPRRNPAQSRRRAAPGRRLHDRRAGPLRRRRGRPRRGRPDPRSSSQGLSTWRPTRKAFPSTSSPCRRATSGGWASRSPRNGTGEVSTRPSPSSTRTRRGSPPTRSGGRTTRSTPTCSPAWRPALITSASPASATYPDGQAGTTSRPARSARSCRLSPAETSGFTPWPSPRIRPPRS